MAQPLKRVILSRIAAGIVCQLNRHSKRWIRQGDLEKNNLMDRRMMGYPLVVAFAAFVAGAAMVEPILRRTGVLASPTIYAEPSK